MEVKYSVMERKTALKIKLSRTKLCKIKINFVER